MHLHIAALVAAACCASFAQAQVASSPVAGEFAIHPLSLEQALEAALARAPALQAAAADIRAAEAGRTIAGLRPNPEVQVEVENVGGTGEYKGTQSAEVTSALALPIELGGKRSARIGLAMAQTTEARVEAMMAAAELREAIVTAYVAVLAADRRVEFATRAAEFASVGHRAASARVTAGSASPIEQQRAEVLRINAELAVEKAWRDAVNARASLGRLTGLPIAGPLDGVWFEQVNGPGPVAPRSVDGTLSLAAAEANLSIASAQVRLARAQRVPDITLSAGARRLSASNDTAAVFGVAVSFPLFNSGRAGVDQAMAQQSAAEARKRVAFAEAEQELARAEAALADASADARAAGGPALAAAQEAARIAELGYASGKFGQLDLIEAQRTLGDTRARHVDALEAYHLAKARLARLMTPAPGTSVSEISE